MTGLACTVDTEISELVALTANAAQEVGLEAWGSDSGVTVTVIMGLEIA